MKDCFVIAPIGEKGSLARRHSDQMLNKIVRPACSRCGYTTIRGDEIARSGLITNQVVRRIMTDPLVIADLTGLNPNVFYELALRHAVRLPVIQMFSGNDRLPFDVSGMRVVFYDLGTKSSIDNAIAQLSQIIQSAEHDALPAETPIAKELDMIPVPGEKYNELLRTVSRARHRLWPDETDTVVTDEHEIAEVVVLLGTVLAQLANISPRVKWR